MKANHNPDKAGGGLRVCSYSEQSFSALEMQSAITADHGQVGFVVSRRACAPAVCVRNNGLETRLSADPSSQPVDTVLPLFSDVQKAVKRSPPTA